MDFWARRPLHINLIGFLLLLGAWIVLTGIFSTLADATRLPYDYYQPLYYLGLLVATLLVVRLYDRMPLAWSGIGFYRRSGRELLLGLALGGGMALLAWAPVAFIAIAASGDGGLRLASGESSGEWLYGGSLIALNAAGEELLFRGYLFQRILEILGSVVATVVVSALFMLAHAWNPNVTTVGLINVFLGGLFFTLCYLRSGALWLPIGAHLAWNFLLGRIVGLPVSGLQGNGSLLRTEVVGPEIVTGGLFGPEGGIVTTIALGLGALLLMRSSLFDLSPYLYSETFRAFHRRQRTALGAPGSKTPSTPLGPQDKGER